MLEIDEGHPDRLLHRNTTGRIIGAAFEVHRELGYGFLERVYERARINGRNREAGAAGLIF